LQIILAEDVADVFAETAIFTMEFALNVPSF